MKTIIESWLPVFQGFYGTIFEYDDEVDDIEEGKTYDDYNWDYADYHQRVARACVPVIEGQLEDFGIKVEFTSLYSPRYYNFSNDQINVKYTLSNDSFDKVVEYCKENLEEFEVFLSDNFKSYDGFSSFYNYDSETWFNEYLKPDFKKLTTLFGSVLQFIIKNEEFTPYNLYEQLCDERYISYELKKEGK